MAKHIIIAGGGVIGVMIAHRLSRQYPGKQITVIERDLLGLGASIRSAGLHFPLSWSKKGRQMTRLSHHLFDQLYAAFDEKVRHILDMEIFSFETDVPDFEKIFVEEAMLSTSKAETVDPLLGLLEQPVALATGAHFVNVAELISTLIKHKQNNVDILEGQAIDDIEVNPSGISIRLSSGKQLHADQLVIAPGPWANMAPFAEWTKPLNVGIKKVIAFHIDAPVHVDSTVKLFPDDDAFLLPMHAQNQWLYSYTCQTWNVTPEPSQLKMTDIELKNAQNVLAQYVPSLAPHLNTGRVFCDAYNDSKAPIIEYVNAEKNIIFAGATNGSGYRLSPAIAEHVVDLLNESHTYEKGKNWLRSGT